MTKFVGITGHGLHAPRFHLQTLNRHAFDTLLLPCNYLLMQDQTHAADFEQRPSEEDMRQTVEQNRMQMLFS
jgi:hypothetical protein